MTIIKAARQADAIVAGVKPSIIAIEACLLYSLMTNVTAAVPLQFTNVQMFTNMPGCIAADLNHDGRPDIITADTVYITLDDCTLSNKFSFTNSAAACLIDVNGNNLLSIARTDMSIWDSLGDGTFTLRTNLVPPAQVPSAQLRVRVGDFNRDGKMDLCFVTDSYSGHPSHLDIWTNSGAGSFQMVPQTNLLSSAYISSVCVADLDCDGAAEAMVAWTSSGRPDCVSVYRGKGDGTFYPEIRAAPFTNNSGASIYIDYPILTVGDFNGDGITDLAVSGDYQQRVSVLLGSRTNLLQAPILSGSDTSYPSGVSCAADVDGDGSLDLIGLAAIWRGRGDGTFLDKEIVYNFFSGRPRSTTIADMDMDGRPDLIVTGLTNGLSSMVLSLNRTDGTTNQANLGITRMNASTVLTWPTSGNGFFTLQENDNVAASNGWRRVTVPPTALGSRFYVTNSPPGGSKFYRLVGP